MRTPPPSDPRRPLSRAAAREAGIPLSELLGPEYQKLFHDSYLPAGVLVTDLVRQQAALATGGDGAFVSHHSAARSYGGVVPDDPDVHISVRERVRRTTRQGIHPHLANPRARVIEHGGVLKSSPAQCVLDLATDLGLVDLVVLADSLVQAGAATPEELIDAADRWTAPGARLARRATRLVRVGAESPMETRQRLLVVLAGLPEPVLQHPVILDGGTRTLRLDMAWPAFRVASEYEGRHHAESPTQWGRDIGRRESLDALRWRLVLNRAPDVYQTPDRTLDRLVAALVAQGAKRIAVSSQEWRRHFPVRHRVA